MGKMSKDQQLVAVCEGLAVGSMELGIERITSATWELKLALSGAWRRWSRASSFPSIGNDPRMDSLLWIGMRKSTRRRFPTAAWHFDGAWVVPALRDEDLPLDQAAAWVCVDVSLQE